MKTRRVALQLHLWLGLTAAVVIFIEGLTGAVLAFGPQLRRSLPPSPKVVVTSQGPDLPYAVLFAKLEAAYPGYELRNVLPAAHAGSSQPWLAFLATRSHWRDAPVAFDPHTGAILHDSRDDMRGRRGTLLRAVFWIGGLHVRVFGETFLGWASAVFLILTITGLILWWPYALFWPKSGRNFDLHATIGFYSSLLVAIFSFTTITMVWPRLFVFSPAATPPIRSSTPLGLEPTPDEIVRRALAAVPGRVINLVRAPGGHRLTVVIVNAHGVAEASFSAETGRLLSVDLPPVPGRGKSFLISMRRIHTANFLGLTGRIIAAASGLAMAILAVTGPLLWWSRRKPRPASHIRSNV